jgi:hypothetical protein
MPATRLPRALTLGLAVACVSILPAALTASLYAQTSVSGDITGTVTDASGAIIPNASVIAVNRANGQKKMATTGAAGSYRISLLAPGTYHLTFTDAGFQTSATDVVVGAGGVVVGDAKLTVGATTTTVEVSEQAPLLHTESAEISTEFTQEQISSLPNPGNDLTFIAQTAPGVIMNTQSGYGNFASFGLPATSNTFTINGGYTNDPFLNLSNSGASNLLLGNNDIGQVTVLSNAYGAQYGGLGGTQVNEITRAGSNRFHGDATYQWNGSVLNGNDYFNNQQGIKRPRSNANQWSGAFGGPIIRDKTFFFFNTEGLRVIIPVRGTVYAPSALFMQTTLASAAAQGPGAVTFYNNFFSSYLSNPHYATATADANDPNAVIFNANAANFAHEEQYTGRIDQRLGGKDNIFVHGTVDRGVQPTFTSLLNPVFNTNSPQPQYSGQLNETHNFSPNVANQFVFAEIYYKAIFQNTTATAANALSPFGIIFLDGDLANNGLNTTPGGADFAFPQGRVVNGYQFIDDLSYSRGKNTYKAGFYMRRDDITDYSPQQYVTPLYESYESDFSAGSATVSVQNFPTRSTQPVAVYNMGIYFQDEIKLTRDLIVTAGMRFEHNSNPVCRTNCFSRLANNFSALPTATTTPYNNVQGGGLINSGQGPGFQNFQKVGYEPRIGFAYTPSALNSKSTIRGGFGIFADSFPAQIADSLLNNAPTNLQFVQFGPGAGGDASPIYPGAPGSFASIGASSAVAFRAGYGGKGSFSSISANAPAFAAPAFASPANTVKYPIYEEYSLAVEQQIGKSNVLSILYVGNHTYDQPVNNNSVNASAPNGFAGLPTSSPNPNFSAVTQIYSAANSNYNGVTVTATKHSTYLTMNFNYTYSHALDEVSNGGFNGFSGNSVFPTNPNLGMLRQNYGNADYDVRHYISSSYVFTMPYVGGPRLLTKGFQIAGTFFHSTGLPFTFTDSVTAGGFQNYGGSLFAQQTVAHIPNKCVAIQVIGAASQKSCAASLDVTSATGFGQQERNQVFGPSYTDADVSVYKSFDVPYRDSVHVKLGVQFFNVFNHPNFAQPAHDLASGSTLGTISATVNPPTSILGSFLGGDASPRLIQLKANLNF